MHKVEEIYNLSERVDCEINCPSQIDGSSCGGYEMMVSIV